MIGTKVIDTADNKHPRLQGLWLTGQVAAAASQPSQALAKGGIEPFNEGRVNLATPLAAVQQLCHLLSTGLNNPADNGQSTIDPLFDHLHDGDFRPGPQMAATELTPARNRTPKSSLKGTDVAHQSIYGQQQRSVQSDGPNLVRQILDQAVVALAADNPTQPQPGRNHHGHRHPNNPALRFDFDFIGLHLLQVLLALSDQMLMHSLTMLPCPLPPRLDRSLIEPKSHYNRLDRTAIGQQAQDQHHGLGICFQPVKNAALRHTEGLVTHVAVTAFFLVTVNADIATITLASCRTIKIRAEYLLEVHWALLLVVVTQKFAREPLFIQIYPFTTL
jgi:hypothetical protein